MALLAIWIDGEKAKLYEFTETNLTHQDMSDPSPAHHTHGEDQMAHQKKEQTFFKTLVPNLTKASSILILGPGMTKSHLQKFITENHADLAKKIVACESSDHPTEPQIIALARKHFNSEKLVSLN